jgi:hypothetical protein
MPCRDPVAQIAVDAPGQQRLEKVVLKDMGGRRRLDANDLLAVGGIAQKVLNGFAGIGRSLAGAEAEAGFPDLGDEFLRRAGGKRTALPRGTTSTIVSKRNGAENMAYSSRCGVRLAPTAMSRAPLSMSRRCWSHGTALASIVYPASFATAFSISTSSPCHC